MTVVGAPSLIADNAVASAIVHGERIDLNEAQIRGLGTMPVSLQIDDAGIAAGTGAMALGHSLNALHYAAGMAITWGSPIRAGELVITGTCTGLVPCTTRTRAVGRFDSATVGVAFAWPSSRAS